MSENRLGRGVQDSRQMTDAASNAVEYNVYDFGGPKDRLLEVAVLRDARFAAGLWFLDMLNAAGVDPSAEDVLLGLYLLASSEYRNVAKMS